MIKISRIQIYQFKLKFIILFLFCESENPSTLTNQFSELWECFYLVIGLFYHVLEIVRDILTSNLPCQNSVGSL